jgi:hypothetical protein
MTNKRATADQKRTLRTVAENGGATPPADIPGGRKLYAPALRHLKSLEARGWLSVDRDIGEDFFVITKAGAEAAGLEWEDEP